MKAWADLGDERQWIVRHGRLEVAGCDPGPDVFVPLLAEVSGTDLLTGMLEAERWASLNGLDRSVGSCVAMSFFELPTDEREFPRWLFGPPTDAERSTDACISAAT